MKQKSIAELMSEMCMMKKHLSSTLFLCRSRQNENITGTARMTLLPDLSRVVIPLYWHLNLLCNSRQCCLKYLLLFLHDQMLPAAVGHMSHRNVQLYYRCCPCDCKSSLLKPIKTIFNPFLLISPSGLSEMQSSRGLPVCIPELRGHAEELNPPPPTRWPSRCPWCLACPPSPDPQTILHLHAVQEPLPVVLAEIEAVC